jgi:hypothetical protein
MLFKLLYAFALIGQGISYSKIYFFHILLLPSLLTTLRFSKVKDFVLQNPLLTIIALYPIFTLTWSPDAFLGLQDVAFILFGVALLYVVSVSNVSSTNLIKIICIIFWLNLFISVLEALDVITYPWSRFSSWASTLGKVHEGRGWKTPTGFYYNPNNNALFILVFTPIVVSTLGFWKMVFLLLVSSIVIFMASSKLVLVGWIFLLAFYLFKLAQEKIGLLRSLILTILSITIMAILFSTSDTRRVQKYSKTIPSLISFSREAPMNFFRRLSGEEVNFDYKSLDMSLHERLMFLDGIAKVLHNDGVWGAGAGSLHNLNVEQAGHVKNMKTPHFYLAEIAAKYGIFYLGIYLFWLFGLFRGSLKVNELFGVSLILFIAFSAVMSSASYFLPKWALYLLLMRVRKESHLNKHFCL